MSNTESEFKLSSSTASYLCGRIDSAKNDACDSICSPDCLVFQLLTKKVPDILNLAAEGYNEYGRALLESEWGIKDGQKLFMGTRTSASRLYQYRVRLLEGLAIKKLQFFYRKLQENNL